MSAEPIHIRPTAPLAERVLLPGDPGRALLLAQAVLREPKMFNHHRGLWGYTGTAADDEPLTIQSTGMGGPSAAIVITELATLGAHRMIRVGTCGALDPTLELGTLLLAREALAQDGTSQALGANSTVRPDEELTDAIAAAARENLHQGPIVSTDLFYDNNGQEKHWAEKGARAIPDGDRHSLYHRPQQGLPSSIPPPHHRPSTAPTPPNLARRLKKGGSSS